MLLRSIISYCLLVAMLITTTGLSTLAADRKNYMKDAPIEAIQSDPANYAKDYIKANRMNTGTFGSAPSVKDLGKVAVTGFQVMFQTQRKVETEGSTLKGITAGQWSDARWQLDVSGLTPELMQKITEQAYESFVAELKAAGYDVIPHEELMANENYRELLENSESENVATSGLPTQRKVDRLFKHEVFTTVVPEGLPLYEVDSSFSPFKNIGRMKQLGKTMKSLGEVSAINAVYHLNTEKLTKINSLWLVKKSEEDKVFGLSVSPGSHVDFIPYNKSYNPGPYTAFAVKAPLADTNPVGLGKFDKENIGAQAIAGTLALLGAPAPNVVRLRKYALDIEPSKYEQTSLELLNATNKLIFASLK